MTHMHRTVHEPLADIAARFPILPARVADALDEYGGDRLAWAWIDEDTGRLLRLEVHE